MLVSQIFPAFLRFWRGLKYLPSLLELVSLSWRTLSQALYAHSWSHQLFISSWLCHACSWAVSSSRRRRRMPPSSGWWFPSAMLAARAVCLGKSQWLSRSYYCRRCFYSPISNVEVSFPNGTSGQEPTCQRKRYETWIQSLSREDPWRGNGNPLQYSCLENPVDRGAWRATVHGVPKCQDMTEWLRMHAILMYS